MGHGNENNWSGRGPFSNLPPWERPGRLYGRGACYYLYGAPIQPQPTIPPQNEAVILTNQKNVIETQIENLQKALAKIQERLNEINK
jgi:Acetylornithine deacetylase/Succinyl-diaminopimelate desuccinylase and related deacylases